MKLNASFNFEMGGKARTFNVDMNMFCEVEQLLGVRVMQENKEFWMKMGFIEMRALGYSMLYAEEPRPSLIEVGSWMSNIDLPKFSSTFTEIIQRDFVGGGNNEDDEESVDPTKD